MSAALSALVWHTAQSGFGALDASRAMIIAGAAVVFLSVFALGAFVCSLAEMVILAAMLPLGFLLIMGTGATAAFLAFLFLLYAAIMMQFQIRNRITVSFYPLVSYGIPAAVTAFAVLFAFMGYLYPVHMNGSLKIPEGAVRPIVPFAESFIASQIPAYKKGMTIDAFLSASAEDMIRQKYGAVSSANKQVQAAVAEAAKKQRSDLSQQLGIPLEGNERIDDVLLRLVNTHLNSYWVSYKEFVPLVIAASMFLAVKSTGFLIGRIAVFLAWLAAHALCAAGILGRKKEQTERETLFA